MTRFTMNCKGDLRVIEKPVVMGILNITPDSFYANSRMTNLEQAIQTAQEMIEAGAYLLDIGGQSTRPGSEAINEQAEMDRVLPIIQTLHLHFPETILSIDTFSAAVAKQAVLNGASIVNDISGGNLDPNMLETVGSLGVPYVCMHMKGNFQSMHQMTDYSNLTTSILDYFIERIDACTRAGIKDVIIDPGFGFSKTMEQNYELLSNIQSLQLLQKPILAGLSRKSMIYKALNINQNEALNGTTALNMVSLLKGASILRVHDVKEASQTIQLFERLSQH